ncbi:hypothetical protein DKX15_14995, partial [Enterococcus faecium]
MGGGITGLSAAIHLREQGKSVIVLEAWKIGHGGSGRNVGLVNAGTWIRPDDVEATLGQRVDLHDAIAVDGKLIKREEAAEATRRVIMYNKPDGEICTRDDPEGRPT